LVFTYILSAGTDRFSRKQILSSAALITYTFLVVSIYPLKHPYFLIPVFYLLILSLVYIACSSDHYFEKKLSRSKKWFAPLIAISFAWSAWGILENKKLNWGFQQYSIMMQIEKIVKFNSPVLIADGIGLLSRENNIPQFVGILDKEADYYFKAEIENRKPDLIFLIPRVEVRTGELRAIINQNYVYVNDFVLTKKRLIVAKDCATSKQILESLKLTFNFPLQVVSFRIYSENKKNLPVIGQCIDNKQNKLDWTIQEITDCSAFCIYDEKGNKQTQFIAIPYQYYPTNYDIGFNKFLDFKNFPDFLNHN
jgi:hypothetical protein